MIESFNGRLRYECRNVHAFELIDYAGKKSEALRIDYNQHRPHGSLGHLTPSEYVLQGQQTTSKTAQL
jgi:putative transposase